MIENRRRLEPATILAHCHDHGDHHVGRLAGQQPLREKTYQIRVATSSQRRSSKSATAQMRYEVKQHDFKMFEADS
jgi:hypothetical protein